jgi:hypothetical protein
MILPERMRPFPDEEIALYEAILAGQNEPDFLEEKPRKSTVETKEDQAPLSELNFLGLGKDREMAPRCARVIVPRWESGREFACVFPDHGSHCATFHWDRKVTQQLKYHCWASGEDREGWHTLAEAFARQRGRPARLATSPAQYPRGRDPAGATPAARRLRG